MNACFYEIIRRSSRGPLPALGLLVFGGAVRADVKVVATVSVTGLPAPPPQPPDAPQPPHFPQQVTTYYKGSRARVEIADGPVTITDTHTGRGYRLDPARKTYFVFVPRGNGHGERFGRGGPPMDGRLTLKASGKTKIIAGQRAHEYAVLSTFLPRSDGFPGGGGFGRPEGPPPPRPQISGEVWLSDTLTLPDRAAGTLGIRGGPEHQLLAETLAHAKRLPLAGRISMTRPGPPPWDRESPTVPTGQKMVTTMTVISVSQAALSDALFQPPAGYTQVSPPQRRRPMGPPPDGRRGPPDGEDGRDGKFGGPPPGGPMGPPPGGDWP